jgi:hypothetical protein
MILSARIGPSSLRVFRWFSMYIGACGRARGVAMPALPDLSRPCMLPRHKCTPWVVP